MRNLECYRNTRNWLFLFHTKTLKSIKLIKPFFENIKNEKVRFWKPSKKA